MALHPNNIVGLFQRKGGLKNVVLVVNTIYNVVVQSC